MDEMRDGKMGVFERVARCSARAPAPRMYRYRTDSGGRAMLHEMLGGGRNALGTALVLPGQ
jgi:hypothetical protein